MIIPTSDTVFPDTGPRSFTADLLKQSVTYAVMAPSSHNTQPWKFRLRWGGLEIVLDRARVLPVTDPVAREMVMSCGAALQNIRIALRHRGYATNVSILPHSSAPDVLARVEIGGTRARSGLNELLFDAIGERRTSRAAYLPVPVSARLVAAMSSAAALENARLHQATDPARRAVVADLVAKATRRQWADPEFRREIAAWMRPNAGSARDGLPGYAFGLSDLAARLAPAVVGRMPLGGAQAKHDRELALNAPLLVILATAGDTTREWMAAGQALQLVLLVAAAHGISASFLNQPVQLPAFRQQLGARLQFTDVPQVIVRMGYGTGAVPTPRRELSEVFERPVAGADFG